tara:strand:+ start:1049 stop:1300 length:252 start_codon:yes stop_codon:yes gene_type:complete
MFKKWLANLITYIILDRLLKIIDDRTYDDKQELEGLRADFHDCQSTVDNIEYNVEDTIKYSDYEELKSELEELKNKLESQEAA